MKCFDFMMVRTENTTVRVVELNISVLQINNENMRCILFDRSMKFYHLLILHYNLSVCFLILRRKFFNVQNVLYILVLICGDLCITVCPWMSRNNCMESVL